MEETLTWTLIITKSVGIFTEQDIIEIWAVQLWVNILLIILIFFYSFFIN